MKEVVCLYHDDCFDGTAAAWVVSKRFPNATLIPVRYNQPPPEGLAGKVVYIVDFCYPESVLWEMAQYVEELHVFDHHKTRADDIRDFNFAIAGLEYPTHKFRGVYRHDVSGAKLTWLELFPDLPVPMIIEHISDRDLYHFKLPETELVMHGLGTYPLDVATWDRLFHWDEGYEIEGDNAHNQVIADLATDGVVAKRKLNTEIDRTLALATRFVTIQGHHVPFINCPRSLGSELLAKIYHEHPFAVAYFDTAESRVLSFRSHRDTGLDVAEIAEVYGGGGHRNAAGFEAPRDHELALL